MDQAVPLGFRAERSIKTSGSPGLLCSEKVELIRRCDAWFPWLAAVQITVLSWFVRFPPANYSCSQFARGHKHGPGGASSCGIWFPQTALR